MKHAVIFTVLYIPFVCFSQSVIKGSVIDAAHGNPVAGASVFISNTSIGTSAGKDGHFELQAVPPGRHELVISAIGYKTNIFSFSSEELPLQLRIELQQKIRVLEEVRVEQFVEEGWGK